MTKKDYIQFATMIKELREVYSVSSKPEDRHIAANVLDNVQRRLLIVFTNDNHRFDSDRFHLACSVDE